MPSGDKELMTKGKRRFSTTKTGDTDSAKASFLHPRPPPLRTLNSMKTGYLIQDVRRVELKNLIAKRGGGSFITGDLAD